MARLEGLERRLLENGASERDLAPFRGLRSNGKSFGSVALGSTGLSVDRLKLVTSDIDTNGRGDVVAYVRRAGGATGTRLITYRSLGTSLDDGDLWLEDTALDWEAAEPY